eukprot:224213_1
MSRGYEMSILWRFRWNSETDTPKNFSFYYGHIEESYDWLSMKQGQNAAKTRDMNEKKVTKSYSVSFYGILSTFYGTKTKTQKLILSLRPPHHSHSSSTTQCILSTR